MFEIVNCGDEGGFWIEGPSGRMGVCFLVKDDAEDYVETLEKGVEAERVRVRKLAAAANFLETSPFTDHRLELAFFDGCAAGMAIQQASAKKEVAKVAADVRAQIKQELRAWLIGRVDPRDAGLVNGRRIVDEIERICPLP